MCHRSCQLDAIFCPYCGSDFGSNANVPGGRPTVRPGDMMPRPSCRLKAIPRDNENIQNGTLTFTGERVILNRANTEETNQTITSKEQAILVCEGGKWYIQDRSEYKTTFIHTAERIELKQGDVIMLGNRRFVFEAD
jgi:hypothetical protein